MKIKRINIIWCLLIVVLDLVSVISLYGARVAFIKARESEILSIYEKTTMIDYSDLWMNFSTINRIVEPILIWMLAIYIVFLALGTISKKIDAKGIVKNITFLIILICVNITPYIIMSISYDKTDISKLWVDACIPIYYGIATGLKYSVLVSVVYMILKKIKNTIVS